MNNSAQVKEPGTQGTPASTSLGFLALTGRFLVFLLPIFLAALCKLMMAKAAGGAEFETYMSPKFIDWSLDLLLSAAAIFFGVSFYNKSSEVGGSKIEPKDIGLCGVVLFVSLILLLFSVIALQEVINALQEVLNKFNWSFVKWIATHREPLATIWIPDAIGLFAFGWIIVKLT